MASFELPSFTPEVLDGFTTTSSAIDDKYQSVSNAAVDKYNNFQPTAIPGLDNLLGDDFSATKKARVALDKFDQDMLNLQIRQQEDMLRKGYSDPNAIMSDEFARTGLGYLLNTAGAVASGIGTLVNDVASAPHNLIQSTKSIDTGLNQAYPKTSNTILSLLNPINKGVVEPFFEVLSVGGDVIESFTDKLHNDAELQRLQAEVGQAYDDNTGAVDVLLGMGKAIALDNPAAIPQVIGQSLPTMYALAARGSLLAATFLGMTTTRVEEATEIFKKTHNRSPNAQELGIIYTGAVASTAVETVESRFLLGKTAKLRAAAQAKANHFGVRTVGAGAAGGLAETSQEGSANYITEVTGRQTLEGFTNPEALKSTAVSGAIGFAAGAPIKAATTIGQDLQDVDKAIGTVVKKGINKIADRVEQAVTVNADKRKAAAEAEGNITEALEIALEKDITRIPTREERKTHLSELITRLDQAEEQLLSITDPIASKELDERLVPLRQRVNSIADQIVALAQKEEGKDIDQAETTLKQEEVTQEDFTTAVNTVVDSIQRGSNITEDTVSSIRGSIFFKDLPDDHRETVEKFEQTLKLNKTLEEVNSDILQGNKEDGFIGVNQHKKNIAQAIELNNKAGADKSLNQLLEFRKALVTKLKNPSKQKDAAKYNGGHSPKFIERVKSEIEAITATLDLANDFVVKAFGSSNLSKEDTKMPTIEVFSPVGATKPTTSTKPRVEEKASQESSQEPTEAPNKKVFDKVSTIRKKIVDLAKKDINKASQAKGALLRITKKLDDNEITEAEGLKQLQRVEDLLDKELSSKKETKEPKVSTNEEVQKETTIKEEDLLDKELASVKNTVNKESIKNLVSKFKGKIILAHAGIGKSFAVKSNPDLIDGDDLFTTAANKIVDKYNKLNKETVKQISNVSQMRSIFEAWGQYDTNNPDRVKEAVRRRDEVYAEYAKEAVKLKNEGKTILTSSARESIIVNADFVIVQENSELITQNLKSDLRVNKNSETDTNKIKSKIDKFKKVGKEYDIPTILLSKDQFLSDVLFETKEPKVSTNKPKKEEVVTPSEDLKDGELNSEQKVVFDKLINFFTKSKENTFVLDAAGGTGKTYTVGKVAEELSKIKGFKKIQYLAPTHVAKITLEEQTKEPAMTIASALGYKLNESTGEFVPDPFSEPKINKGAYLIIDESSMINTIMYQTLLDVVGSTGKIVFMGDSAQLPPIGKNEPSVSPALTNSKEKGTLIKPMRFDGKSTIGKLAMFLRENSLRLRPRRSLEVFKQVVLEGNTSIIKTVDSAIDSFISDYKKDPFSTVMVTFNNEKYTKREDSVYSLNKSIREKLQPDNIDNYVEGDVLVAYSTLTEEDAIIVSNSQRIQIKSVGNKRKKLFKGTAGSKRKSVRVEIELEYQTATLTNGKVVDIISPSSKRKLSVEANKAFNEKKFAEGFAYSDILQSQLLDVEFGYSITSHKSQGQTFNNVYVMVDNILGVPTPKDQVSSLYVAASRPRNKLVLVSNKIEGKEFNKEETIKNTNNGGTGNVSVNTNGKLKGYINHSGGAKGADTIWGEIGAKLGTYSNHYWYGNKTPTGNLEITEEQFNEGIIKAQAAAKALGKNWSNKPFIQALLSRNWQQVKNSDAIFAVGEIEGAHVKGGTGYAVEMAKAEGKPIYVFDQIKNNWYEYTENKWVKISTPVLTKNFAGIGTRNINANGKAAIEAVYQNTIKPDLVEEVVTTDTRTFTIDNQQVEVTFVDSISDKAHLATTKDGKIIVKKGLTKDEILSHIKGEIGSFTSIQKQVVNEYLLDNFNINLIDVLNGLNRNDLIKFIVAHEIGHLKQDNLKERYYSNTEQTIADTYGKQNKNNKYLSDSAIKLETGAHRYALKVFGIETNKTDSATIPDTPALAAIKELVIPDPSFYNKYKKLDKKRKIQGGHEVSYKNGIIAQDNILRVVQDLVRQCNG